MVDSVVVLGFGTKTIGFYDYEGHVGSRLLKNRRKTPTGLSVAGFYSLSTTPKDAIKAAQLHILLAPRTPRLDAQKVTQTHDVVYKAKVRQLQKKAKGADETHSDSGWLEKTDQGKKVRLLGSRWLEVLFRTTRTGKRLCSLDLDGPTATIKPKTQLSDATNQSQSQRISEAVSIRELTQTP